MEVLVTEVSGEDVQVVARPDGSRWYGLWRGPTAATAGLHNVELDVPDTLRWVAGDVAVGTTQPGNVLFGVVEDAEEDGVLTLRVNGGLVLVDVPEPLPSVGQSLRVEGVAMFFYPC